MIATIGTIIVWVLIVVGGAIGGAVRVYRAYVPHQLSDVLTPLVKRNLPKISKSMLDD